MQEVMEGEFLNTDEKDAMDNHRFNFFLKSL